MRAWSGRAPELGERIEFFLPHRGPAHTLGRATRVEEQPGLRALPLDHLWVLEEFAEPLEVPPFREVAESLTVRVPSLGAFVLNKANTFSLRAGPERQVRAGKDLVYLRDVLAAGEAAQTVVAEDLAELLAGDDDRRITRTLERALYHLRSVAGRYHPHAGEILGERDGIAETDARADIEGHLADLVDLLSARLQDDAPEGARPDGGDS